MSFLSNLFKPKWQHSDPAIRKQALLALTPEHASDPLRQIAQRDASAELRQFALKRLNDLSLFEQSAGNDNDPDVRELSKKMVLQFLAGQHPSAPPLAERLLKIRSTQDSQLREYVAKNADATELRLEALNGIEKESVAADLAINDSDLVIRQAALAKVRSKATLERIARATKNKDKVISHSARERYEQIVADEEKPRKIAEQRRNICASLETLGRSGDWLREKNQFDQLCAHWTALEPIAREDFATRFAAATANFDTRYAAYVERNAERVAAEQALVPLRLEKERLLRELETLEATTANEPVLDETAIRQKSTELETLQNRWNAVGALPEQEQTQFETRQRQAASALRARLDKATRALSQGQRLQELCALAETEAAKPLAPKEKTLENLERRWKDATGDLAPADEIKARFDQALGLARSKRKAELESEDQARSAISKLNETIQTALDEGRLNDALALHKQAGESIKTLEKTGAHDLDKQKAKLAAHYAQIQKLNNWRTWANTPQKELLCVQIEALIGSQDHPREIAGAISAAREAWQKLGPAERDSSAELWARFQAACDNAYEPCRAFFAAEAQQREENLAARNQFLEKLETFVGQVDWPNADWKKIEPLPQQLLAEWQQMGPTDRVHSNALSKRFTTALQKVRDAIGDEWNRNLPRKQSVVSRALALVESADANAAADQAKKLQAEWKTLGRVGQKQERELWTQFRTACDQVFARRDKTRLERESQIEQGLTAKRDMVQQAETLAGLEGTALLGAQEAFREIQDKFSASAPTRRDDDQKFERAMSQATKKLEKGLYQATRQSALNRVSSIRPRAALCARAEQAIGSLTATAPTQEEWDATTPPIDQSHAERINTRWRDVAAIATAKAEGNAAPWRTYLAESCAAKSILALRFEILAGIESPADIAKSRLEYQVSQLAQHMGQTKTQDRWSELLALEAEWLLCGGCEVSEESKLEARHAAVLAELKKTFTQELHNYY